MALELCDEMTEAVTGEAASDSPKSVHEWVQAFFKRMRDRGFRQLNHLRLPVRLPGDLP